MKLNYNSKECNSRMADALIKSPLVTLILEKLHDKKESLEGYNPMVLEAMIIIKTWELIQKASQSGYRYVDNKLVSLRDKNE